jgi:hypothetical protein
MTEIKMTPALHAALLSLRKADSRNKADRLTNTTRLKAYDAWLDAAEVVSAILNPGMDRS